MKCPGCGILINPAAEMGKMKKTMSPAALLQRKKAANSIKRSKKHELQKKS